MVKLVCGHCNFRCDVKNNSLECPYCGRNTLEKEKSAEEILDEVSNVLSK